MKNLLSYFFILSLLSFTLIFECKSQTNKQKSKNPYEDCTFDTTSYEPTTKAIQTYNKTISYSWNQETKTAKCILPDGDILFLHIGGCDHYSYSAELHTAISYSQTEKLIEKTRWVAMNFFSDGFDKQYDQLISSGKYKIEEPQKKDFQYYDLIEGAHEPTNHILDGFSFLKNGKGTIIRVSAYIN